jgi:hypothetical protein
MMIDFVAREGRSRWARFAKRLGSALKHSAQLPVRDSHSTGVKLPKTSPFVSWISVSVGAWPSHGNSQSVQVIVQWYH